MVFTRIKINTLNLVSQIKESSDRILKTTMLLNIVLAIPFCILFFTDYHTNSPSIESFFYNFTFFSLGLVFILLQVIKEVSGKLSSVISCLLSLCSACFSS